MTAGLIASESSSSAPPLVRPAAPSRQVAIDFVKGALVVLMVAYHTMNYFRHEPALLRYLHFLPSSFIFITGFLISFVYRSRADRGEPVLRRLLTRAAKLFGIFVALNVAAHASFDTNYNRPLGFDFLLDHLGAFFVTGEPRVAVFDVLLPIAYLLAVAAVLLQLRSRIVYAAAALGLIAACAAVAVRDHMFFNLELLSHGLLGIIAGLLSLAAVDRIAGRIALLSTAFAVYLAAITASYPTYGVNLAGVPLTLLVLYAIAKALPSRPAWYRTLVLLGQYSLFAYIAQIAILQASYRIAGRLHLGAALLLLAFGAAVAATTLVVVLVDRARRGSRRVAACYASVFG